MRQHQSLRNEAHIDDERIRRFAKPDCGERARIDPFERADARVRRKARIKLSVADIDGDDLRRAARQQDVGEAPSRGADVEADKARGIESEGVERGGKLDPAARRPGVGCLGLDRRVAGDFVRGLLNLDPADADQPGRDRGLRAGATEKTPRSTRTISARLRMSVVNERSAADCQ